MLTPCTQMRAPSTLELINHIRADENRITKLETRVDKLEMDRSPPPSRIPPWLTITLVLKYATLIAAFVALNANKPELAKLFMSAAGKM